MELTANVCGAEYQTKWNKIFTSATINTKDDGLTSAPTKNTNFQSNTRKIFTSAGVDVSKWTTTLTKIPKYNSQKIYVYLN